MVMGMVEDAVENVVGLNGVDHDVSVSVSKFYFQDKENGVAE